MSTEIFPASPAIKDLAVTDLPLAQQARQRLEAAAEVDCTPTSYSGNPTLNYVDGLAALRDAEVGSGHAVLAVQAELAAMRGELRAGREEVAGLAHVVRKEIGGLADAVRDLVRAVGNGTDRLADGTQHLADIADGIGDIAAVGGRMSEVAEAIDALADDLASYHRPWWQRWRGRRGDAEAFPVEYGASIAAPAPAPQEAACRCVWQGGTCVESCPAHTPEAFIAGVEAHLDAYNQQARRWWRWGR